MLRFARNISSHNFLLVSLMLCLVAAFVVRFELRKNEFEVADFVGSNTFTPAPFQGRESNDPGAISQSPSATLSITPVVFVEGNSDRPLDITFDDLAFEIEKDGEYDESMLTDEIREMDGKRILIRGYMQPSFKQRGIKKFVFVRDNQECCFGPGAALYDCMIVKLMKGKSTTFQVRPFAVKGELSISEYEGPDGKPWAIFQLRDAEVVE